MFEFVFAICRSLCVCLPDRSHVCIPDLKTPSPPDLHFSLAVLKTEEKLQAKTAVDMFWFL